MYLGLKCITCEIRYLMNIFGIDYEIIWDVAKNYLPENKGQIDKIIKEEISKMK